MGFFCLFRFVLEKQELLYIIRATPELTAGSKFLGVALLTYFPRVASSRVRELLIWVLKHSQATSGQGEELTLPCCRALCGFRSEYRWKGEGWA